MSTAAHSKDNGSPTSVAHKLDDDQTDSVVVRRDDLVVIDNAALGIPPPSRRPELDHYEERPRNSLTTSQRYKN